MAMAMGRVRIRRTDFDEGRGRIDSSSGAGAAVAEDACPLHPHAARTSSTRPGRRQGRGRRRSGAALTLSRIVLAMAAVAALAALATGGGFAAAQMIDGTGAEEVDASTGGEGGMLQPKLDAADADADAADADAASDTGFLPPYTDGCPSSVQPPLYPTSGSYGNVFTVRTAPSGPSVLITGLDFYTDRTYELHYEVYTMEGTYGPSDLGNFDSWTLISKGSTLGRGEMTVTPIPDDTFQPVSVDGNGATRSFYVTLNTTDVRYQEGLDGTKSLANPNPTVHASSAELEILAGLGVIAYPFPSYPTQYKDPRNFLGTVRYTSEWTCAPTSAPTAPTSKPTDEPTFAPTSLPTDEPTSVPTELPTALPATDGPTSTPTEPPIYPITTRILYTFAISHPASIPESELVPQIDEYVSLGLEDLLLKDGTELHDLHEGAELELGGVVSFLVQDDGTTQPCVPADTESTCSEIATTVSVTHLPLATKGSVRRAVLLGIPELIGASPYATTYTGEQSVQVDMVVTLVGVPDREMTEEEQRTFERVLQEFLAGELRDGGTDITDVDLMGQVINGGGGGGGGGGEEPPAADADAGNATVPDGEPAADASAVLADESTANDAGTVPDESTGDDAGTASDELAVIDAEETIPDEESPMTDAGTGTVALAGRTYVGERQRKHAPIPQRALRFSLGSVGDASGGGGGSHDDRRRHLQSSSLPSKSNKVEATVRVSGENRNPMKRDLESKVEDAIDGPSGEQFTRDLKEAAADTAEGGGSDYFADVEEVSSRPKEGVDSPPPPAPAPAAPVVQSGGGINLGIIIGAAVGGCAVLVAAGLLYAKGVGAGPCRKKSKYPQLNQLDTDDAGDYSYAAADGKADYGYADDGKASVKNDFDAKLDDKLAYNGGAPMGQEQSRGSLNDLEGDFAYNDPRDGNGGGNSSRASFNRHESRPFEGEDDLHFR